MSETPEEIAKRRQLLKELAQLELQAGDSEEFIDGMAEVHEVVYTTLDRLQQSLNDMMGVYMDMPQDITKQNPEVKELSAMYAVLTQFREMFIDNYDEAMRNYHSSKNQTL